MIFVQLACKPTGIREKVLRVHTFDTDRQSIGHIPEYRKEEERGVKTLASSFKILG
jgi:hypothetical protein